MQLPCEYTLRVCLQQQCVTRHLYTTSLSALHVRPTHNARFISPPLLLLLPLKTEV